jgi:hypothetical protein
MFPSVAAAPREIISYERRSRHEPTSHIDSSEDPSYLQPRSRHPPWRSHDARKGDDPGQERAARLHALPAAERPAVERDLRCEPRRERCAPGLPFTGRGRGRPGALVAGRKLDRLRPLHSQRPLLRLACPPRRHRPAAPHPRVPHPTPSATTKAAHPSHPTAGTSS